MILTIYETLYDVPVFFLALLKTNRKWDKPSKKHLFEKLEFQNR